MNSPELRIDLPDQPLSRIHWYGDSGFPDKAVVTDFYDPAGHQGDPEREQRDSPAPKLVHSSPIPEKAANPTSVESTPQRSSIPTKEAASPASVESTPRQAAPAPTKAYEYVRMQGVGRPRSKFWRLFDLTVFLTALILVAAPAGYPGSVNALIASAIASNPLHLSFTGYVPLAFHPLSIQISLQGLLLTCAFVVFLNIIFTALGLYSPDRAGRNSARDLIDFVAVAFLAAATIWMASLLIDLPRGVAASFFSAFVVACGASLLARLVAKPIARRAIASNAQRKRHAIIVGTNRRAVDIARRIDACPESNLKVVGFVDQHWVGEDEFRQSGYKLVCDFEGFQDFLKDNVVDEAIICLPLKSHYDKSAQIFAQCERQGITVRFRSDPVNPIIGRSWIGEFEGQPVLTIDFTPSHHVSLFVKLLVDRVGSAALLLMLLPLLLVIALAIKLTSDGPVLFTQERVGLNKRRFRFYKFRTMVVDAEQRLASLESLNEVTGPVFKIKRDPRVTRVGRFLRKSSLDELPQLLNVLKGEMSLVGPRPLAVRDYLGITEDWQRRRLSVPPGITCLWQVMGRNSIPFNRWMELDLEYIDNWSFLLDLKICMKTIPAVISGSGAS